MRLWLQWLIGLWAAFVSLTNLYSMPMWWNKKYDINQVLKMIPTSKYDLKMQCLKSTNGDLKAASELYDFLAKDIELPDVTPPEPDWIEKTKSAANGLFSLFDENEERVNKIIGIVNTFRKPKVIPKEPIPDLPPKQP